MRYPPSRLAEALAIIREVKKHTRPHAFKTANLESHVLRTYELRNPQVETTILSRPVVWAEKDDDSDGEFEPSTRRKKSKNTPLDCKPAKSTHKRKISLPTGDESGTGQKKQRKQTGTTWAKGRRLGKALVTVFNFTKPESLASLQDLVEVHGIGSTKMPPHEEAVNVFNKNFLDSGFTPPSPPDPPPIKQSQACLPCKEDGLTCSLLDTHPDYAGRCDECESVDGPCRVNENDEPRMGPLDRMDAERACSQPSNTPTGLGSFMLKRKPKPEKFENLDGGRFGSGSTSFFGDKTPERNIHCLDTSRANKYYDFSKPPDSGYQSANTLGFSNETTPEKKCTPINTNYANSIYDFTRPPPDSGYHSACASRFRFSDIHMGNTIDEAIDLTGSPTPSASLSPTPAPSSSSSQFWSSNSSTTNHHHHHQVLPTTPANPTRQTITTSWVHPISFEHPTQPCHFCQDFRYGHFGAGTTTVNVVWIERSQHYIEFTGRGGDGGGNRAAGKEATRMCVMCALERLRIRFCGAGCGDGREGHGSGNGKGQGKADASGITEETAPNNHALLFEHVWAAFDQQVWLRQLVLSPTDPQYKARPLVPSCSLCWMPATWRCGTLQGRDLALRPLNSGSGDGMEEKGRGGCGLRLCEACKSVVTGEVVMKGGGGDGNDGGRLWRFDGGEVFKRADAEFLFPGSLLERGWGEYLVGVGLGI